MTAAVTIRMKLKTRAENMTESRLRPVKSFSWIELLCLVSSVEAKVQLARHDVNNKILQINIF